MKKPLTRSFWKNLALAGAAVLAIAVLAFLLANPLQKPVPAPPVAAFAATTTPFTQPIIQTIAAASPTSTSAPATPKLFPATTNPPVTPTATLAATFTPALSPTQDAGEPGLTVISPTVAVGEQIPAPFSWRMPISVYRTDEPPLLSLQDARKLVYERSMSWAFGGFHDSKRVTLTAVLRSGYSLWSPELACPNL